MHVYNKLYFDLCIYLFEYMCAIYALIAINFIYIFNIDARTNSSYQSSLDVFSRMNFLSFEPWRGMYYENTRKELHTYVLWGV